MQENEIKCSFVYGTLRPGYGNARLWFGYAEGEHDGEAVVNGFRLVGHAFPYAIRDEHSSTVGCLVYPRLDTYDYVTDAMDMLEGVPTHYRRIQVPVSTPDGEVQAWMYEPAAGSNYGHMTPVNTDEQGRYDWRLGLSNQHR